MPKRPLQLGQPTAIPASPEEAVLDRVPNPHPDTDYAARFTFPEFTAICPVTGQPDFGTLVIDYAPRGWLVEPKSLKLYLNSFRNHGAFHEECTVAIGKKLVALLKPKWLRIGGYFHPRGGTSKLPQPPLLLVTDRRQARRPLHTVVTAALSAGCRWVSLREKDPSLQHTAQQNIPARVHPLRARPATVPAGRMLRPGCGITAGKVMIIADDNAMLSRELRLARPDIGTSTGEGLTPSSDVKPASALILTRYALGALTCFFNALQFAELTCETGGENGYRRLRQGVYLGSRPKRSTGRAQGGRGHHDLSREDQRSTGRSAATGQAYGRAEGR
jgi:7-cyano-7-deazaguanine reductase